MKLAIIGSRSITTELQPYLPKNIKLIISGGARGIDTLAQEYANKHNIPITVFLPDYKTYGKKAPLIRNELIVKEADFILAIWDGKSRGTYHTIDIAKRLHKPIHIVIFKN